LHWVSVARGLEATALPVPFGFTTWNEIVYVELLAPPDSLRVIVTEFPRLMGAVGLMASV